MASGLDDIQSIARRPAIEKNDQAPLARHDCAGYADTPCSIERNNDPADHMPTLKQLRYLAAIADMGHFARAAQLCHITQPTLSAQIAALESRLGATLVERGRQGVSLTPTGRQVLERATAALRCVEEIREMCRATKNGMAGTIRVGVLPTLGPYLLPELLPEIRTR